MAFLTSSSATRCGVLACFLALAFPVLADDGNYLSRRDTISLSAGDATAGNIAIETPTPWPSYVNDRLIPGQGPPAIVTITNYNNKTLKLSEDSGGLIGVPVNTQPPTSGGQ